MSIEMENPKTVQEQVDAAWNWIEQARMAMTLGHRGHLEKAISEASRLLSVAMEGLEQNPITKLRAVVSRQDENENDDRVDTLYGQLREAVITLFEDPAKEV
jgi:hypothetical protein